MSPLKKAWPGLCAYRFMNNPEELRFAVAWEKTNVLRYLLSTHDNNRLVVPSERDETVAATVIQWLGSPVGQAFLSDLGYTKT